MNTATISVRGVFVVTDHTGTDITPRKRKERGLLALIAMAPQKRRSRNWIKTKLWSERDPKQAAGSLRRALCDLRIDLGQAGGGLAGRPAFPSSVAAPSAAAFPTIGSGFGCWGSSAAGAPGGAQGATGEAPPPPKRPLAPACAATGRKGSSPPPGPPPCGQGEPGCCLGG